MKSPDIALFEILIATAESKNLFEAGGKLGISQPAVSVKLKELSAQTPLPVFSYEGKRKVLTHYGRELYEIAKRNQTSMKESYEELNRKYAMAESLTLRVGARSDLFEAIAKRLKFSGKIQFVSLTSKDAIENLLSHKIDIAISFERPNSPEILAKKLFESIPKFVVHKKYLKQKLSEALIRDDKFLLGTPCVFYNENGDILTDWLNFLNFPLDKVKVSGVAEDWKAVQALIDQGWGYGIVPNYIDSLNPDVISISLPQGALTKYTFYALFYKDLKKIPAFEKSLEFKK